MLEAGLRGVGCPASECVVVGDSEQNDVRPGRRLGVFTIRVAIEEEPPESSDADLVVTSLRRPGHCTPTSATPGRDVSWANPVLHRSSCGATRSGCCHHGVSVP